MFFDQVHIISKHIQPVPLAEVEQLEAQLGVTLPTGYTNFITRFGAGIYCDIFRIYVPSYILQEYVRHREFWKEWHYADTQGKLHWFFEGSEAILNEAQLQESVIIGDSIDGDELVFYPPQPDKIFILPRHSDEIVWVKADLTDLHTQRLTAPRVLTFTTWHEQVTLNFRSKQYTLTKETCIEQFRARWGSDALLMTHAHADERSWRYVFFLPPIGGRVQILQDEQVTRTITQDNGCTETIRGNGQRSLNITIHCDTDAAADVEAFIAHLEAQGLATF